MTLSLLTFVALALSAHASPCGPDSKVPCVKLASGHPMPLVAMGSWGGSNGCKPGNFTCNNAYVRRSFKSWLDLGGRHIDTANDYKDQVTVGNFLSGYGLPREDLFITTKCPGTIGYEATIQCVDDNIQMLQLLGDENKEVNGYIDLLLVHFPASTPLECRFRDIDACFDVWMKEAKQMAATKETVQSTWKALEALKKIGVLKSIGVSSYTIQHLEWTLEIATEPIDVNQVSWSPSVHDDELLKFCKDHGITVQAFSPLGGNQEFNARLGVAPTFNPWTSPVLKEIAANHGVPIVQVMLRWSVQQGVAITTSSDVPAHQKGDMELWGFELSSSEMAAISGLAPSPTEPPTVLYS